MYRILFIGCMLGLLIGAGPAMAGDTEGGHSAVPLSEWDIQPLLIGEEIPQLTLTTPDDEPAELREPIMEKPMIVILYRGGW